MKTQQREQALAIYQQHQGKITNRAIADTIGVSAKTIGIWKKQDKWKEALFSASKNEQKQRPINNDELNERQRLFCLYYVKKLQCHTVSNQSGLFSGQRSCDGQPTLKKRKGRC